MIPSVNLDKLTAEVDLHREQIWMETEQRWQEESRLTAWQSDSGMPFKCDPRYFMYFCIFNIQLTAVAKYCTYSMSSSIDKPTKRDCNTYLQSLLC